MADNQLVRVLFDYTYTPKEGADPVSFKRGEEYILFKKTNDEWWNVYKPGSKPVFVPAKYVEILDKQAKKKLPSKPPKVPPKPPKPLDADAVLKELDDMLDTVIAVDDTEYELRESKTDDSCSIKDDGSQTASTPGGDNSNLTSSENISEEKTNSRDSLHSSGSSDKQTETVISHNGNGKTDSTEIYANFEVISNSGKLEPKSTLSLDRNLQQKAPSEISHGRSASVSGPMSVKNNSDSNRQRYPKPEPRLSGTNYYEEPAYANLEALHIKPPPPRPPPPKQGKSELEKVIRKDSDDDSDSDGIPDYANVASLHQPAIPDHPPPSRPPPGATIICSVNTNWAKYHDDDTDVPYYYNASTGESMWRPPFPDKDSEAKNTSACSRQLSGSSGSLPPGWTEHCTDEGEVFFTNQFNNDKWLSSTDETGQVYYYKEGSTESAWELPESPSTVHEEEEDSETRGEVFENSGQSTDAQLSIDQVGISSIPSHARIREMQTALNKTKVTENGKKVKKNWSQSWVITTGPNMYFYKDQKSAQPKPNLPLGKYEAEIDLRGAKVELAPKELSSKKNVILVSTASGTQYLLQSDDKARMQDWYQTLSTNISLLGGYQPTAAADLMVPSDAAPSSPNPQTKSSKAKKATKKTGTLERPTTPDDTLSVAEKNSKIKDWLLYWLLRRPTVESLKEKGIIKDGIFGSHLQSICDREKGDVPRFVHDCIMAVDARGLTVDGIYRISGNMANIQKLRLRVDHNEPYDLMSSDFDIHDITGALKLFFRELQEPLFPYNSYQKFTKAAQISDRSAKLKAFQDVVKELPKVNFCTMKKLMGHLAKVVEHSKQNRMEAQNVAIVFGPTLMRPSNESSDMATSLVMQGRTVEYMLHEHRHLF